MNYYVGIDLSLEAPSLCIVNANGKIIREGKVASEPEDLVTWLRALKLDLARIGLEAHTGPVTEADDLLHSRKSAESGQLRSSRLPRICAKGIASLWS